jgi:hypothetical protein
METTESKFYWITRENFFAMKAEQKAIAHERRYQPITNAYNSAMSDWHKAKPEYMNQHIQKKCDMGHTHSVPNPDYPKYESAVALHKSQKPVTPAEHTYNNDDYARSFNIAYGIAKGKMYSEIELKVRDLGGGNMNYPNWYEIQKICAKFGISKSYMEEKKNG